MMTEDAGDYSVPIKLDTLQNSAVTSVSVPLAKGVLHELTASQILANGAPIPCGAKALTNWPDGSIKWLHLTFAVPKNLREDLIFRVAKAKQSETANAPESLSYISNDSHTTVTHSLYRFTLTHADGSFSIAPGTADDANKVIRGCLNLHDAHSRLGAVSSCQVSIDHTQSLLDGAIYALSAQVDMTYALVDDDTVSNITSTSVFLFTSAHEAIKLDVTLHNANAAVHSGGSWDLGDANSFYFSALTLAMKGDNASTFSYRTEQDSPWQTHLTEAATNTSNVSIQQFSSGGENWLSPVHVDHRNTLPFSVNGYQVDKEGEVITSGQRATPLVSWADKVSVTIENFWQKFPTSINMTPNEMLISFFPAQKNHLHELQGGEKSTHSVWLSTNDKPDSLDELTSSSKGILFCGEYLHSEIPLYTECQNAHSTIQDLINNGLHSQNNFFEKREKLDEYGWRNFGDIYADHETAEHQDDSIFVSHYNNQYDPIYGFLRQFILSNDQQWFTLADDLAKHVMDIDIYHTKQDKDEYNGGLFWHTDHYLQAFTSSHRSYSKHQGIGAYQDHAGGGGPGGQHCYTSGLALYYILTGNPNAKEAVQTLTQWITYVYEGGNTCLELLLALKNRHVLGLKNHFTGQYPLDRGTANYINALLDSYVITSERASLQRVEHVIQHTIHPNEDVTLRHLSNVEETWFYTVFLQSLVRYLDIKSVNKEFDDAFYYARDGLLCFAQWMLEHEYMYLDKPEILEYPNDTWTAQDLRKAHVLSAAYFYGNKHDHTLLQKAEYFENEVSTRLEQSDTKTYTRIMVLLMQNDGPTSHFKHAVLPSEFNARKTDWVAPAYAKGSNVTRIIKAFVKRMLALSISNEVNWLKKRLG